jgi:hypothetical protein
MNSMAPHIQNELAALAATLAGALSVASPGHASIVQDLADKIKTDPGAAARQYRSVDIWGGSGSVADIWCPDEALMRLINDSLIALEEGFARAGVDCPRARQWTDTFRDWRDTGVR